MQTALERWHGLVDARAGQMDAAYERLGRTSANFWDRRARNFHRATKETPGSDLLFLRLREVVTPQTTVLDVGAGTGRFALALAPFVQHVTAVEPNPAMLGYLRQDAQEQHLSNISYVPTTWQDAPDDLAADIVICSHVLYPIREVDVFLAKLRKATRQDCYVYMRAKHFDEISSPLWQHFHGVERFPMPSYIHALAVMYDMGIYADVEIVELPPGMRFSALDVAVEEMQEMLILPDDEQKRAELRAMLTGWLVERDGILSMPVDKLICAIMRFSEAS
ncbi:MAG: class I SAM-dependent methyltransferase [Ktedonobacteraceae bacterium]